MFALAMCSSGREESAMANYQSIINNQLINQSINQLNQRLDSKVAFVTAAVQGIG